MTVLQVPATSGETYSIELIDGESLYVLGANGSGKSTILFRWARDRSSSTLLAGNRTVIFESAAVTVSPGTMNQYATYAEHALRQPASRHQASHLNNPNSLKRLLAGLKARGEHAYRNFFEADAESDEKKKAEIRATLPDIRINNAMSAAGLPLNLKWNKKSELSVSKQGVDVEYGINEMSDGERSALILAATSVLAEENTPIFIDEPERHLHRSISSPLIEFLRKDRPDLSWVIATHDLSLVRDDPTASILVLYSYDGSSWLADTAADLSSVDPKVTDAIYGARDKVLFVEGDDQSLDKPLYSMFFPTITIQGVGNCKDVRNAVRGLRNVRSIHHMEPRGLVDADNRTDITALESEGIKALGLYAVESIYYRSEVVGAVLDVSGSDAPLSEVIHEACACVTDEDLTRFARDASYKAFRRSFDARRPSVDNFENFEGQIELVPDRDFPAVDTKYAELQRLRDAAEWDELVSLVKVKGCRASGQLATRLGYASKGAYELAARKVLTARPDIITGLRPLIPNPFADPATTAVA